MYTYVSSWIRLVSTMGSTGGLLLASAAAAFSSPFSFALVSDLWEPDEEDGRSSSGLGCIKVNGNSATNSLKIKKGWIEIENYCSKVFYQLNW